MAIQRHLVGWSFSPDRRRLALGNETGTIRVVDTVRMRLATRFDTGVGGSVLATHWVAPGRLLAVVDTTLVLFDVGARKVLRREELYGWLVAVTRTPRGLVLLLSPPLGLGPSTLAVADRNGVLRTVRLTEIPSGRDEIDHERAGLFRQAKPALAVDPEGGRAYVVAAAAPVAEVDLASLTVGYHALAEPVSMLGRLHDWLEPRAEAKGAAVGPRRYGRWLGNGMIAVWGADDGGRLDARGVGGPFQEAAGLRVIDVRDWTVRTLDRGASEAAFADGLVLASASLWSSAELRARGMGLTAYGSDGSRRFHVLGSDPVWDVQVVGRRAIAARQEDGGRSAYTVLDLDSGRVDATVRPSTSFVLLNGDASRWYG